MSYLNKTFRFVVLLVGGLFFLVLVYGVGHLLSVAEDSIYHGERGPYLQMASADTVTIRWQSRTRYRGVVRYGTQSGQLTRVAHERESRFSHEVRLSGLQAATRYFYAMGPESGGAAAGPDNWFVTSPVKGSDQSARMLVLGDPGLASARQTSVTDAALEWLRVNKRPNRAELDLLLTTGDNAYGSGKNSEFQQHFFEPYKKLLRNVPVWPVYGNHDARRWSFFEIFSFPTRGEAGGLASDTEHYYSFDYGQLHIVMLDSQASRAYNNREMVNWLKRDLELNQLPWVITLFHHPPYTKGSHNSDSLMDSRGRMFDMRRNVLPVLERYGVDLILSGHSHMYERSYLLDCHYGTSDSLQPGMILSRNMQHYQKRSPGKGAHEGAIYAVVGSSARTDIGSLNHPAMATSLAETGALVIDVNGKRLVARFISGDGVVADHFTVNKGVADAPVGQCGQ